MDPAYAYEPSWVRHGVLPEQTDEQAAYAHLINWGWILDELKGCIFPAPLMIEQEPKFCQSLRKLRNHLLRKKDVSVESFRGQKQNFLHYVHNALKESGFDTAPCARDVLQRCFLDKDLTLTAHAQRAKAQGAYRGLSYWRSRTAIANIGETMSSGLQPQVRRPKY